MNTPATTATTPALRPEIIASLVLNGDLARLSPRAKVEYYNYRCAQAELDPAAKPFDILKLNSKEVLYANAGAAQQLRANRKLSARIIDKQRVEDVYCVWYEITGADGTVTQNMGSVQVGNLKGEALANAMMKATTKALRRSILAHCGLGMLDEDEVINQEWTQPLKTIGRPGDAPVPELSSEASTDGDGNQIWEWSESETADFNTALDVLDALMIKAGWSQKDYDSTMDLYKGQKAGQAVAPEVVLRRMAACCDGIENDIKKQEAKK